MYWGSGPAGLRLTHRPLGPFIQSLAQVGRNAAQRMYNCSGDAWVAHGSTDHSLDGGLRADSYWVFCSTCGLWAALQLFENLLFGPFDDTQAFDVLNALSVLRGASHFLKQFSFYDPDSGLIQTGPTTSPENSYMVFRNSSTIPVVRNVSSTLSRFVQHAEGSGNSTDLSNSSVAVNKTMTITTWELQIENQTFPASSWTQHLAFTPSFDSSLIRQLANSFPLLTQWARKALNESLYPDSIRDKDEMLANDLVKLARALPNVANPIIGKSNTVLEYPTPMGSCGRHDEFSFSEATPKKATPKCFAGNGGNDTTPLLVTESPDTGHRHFSGMHWLYPNTFLPLRDGEKLIEASRTTLDQKRKAGGGHTGWSASWLASLSARLRDGEGAWASIGRLILHYTTRNGLDLHPPLAGLPKDAYATKISAPLPRNCDTCFHERDRAARGFSFDSSQGRGLETSRSDKFQLDGHGGLTAAVSELLLMSHIPGAFLVIPGVSSLPLSLGGGKVRGIQARGDASISVSWTGHGDSIAVTSLEILFGSAHPWLFGSGWSEVDGYYSHPNADIEPNDGQPIAPLIRIYAPTRGDHSHGNNGRAQLQLQTSPCAKQLDDAEFSASLGRKPPTLPKQLIAGMDLIYLSVENFPCRVELA